MASRLGAKPGDLMMFIADSPKIVAETLAICGCSWQAAEPH